jgi:hypothetical protein
MEAECICNLNHRINSILAHKSVKFDAGNEWGALNDKQKWNIKDN